MTPGSIVWLTWRQHRWPVVGVTALALGAASILVSTEAERQLVGSLMLPGFYAIFVQLVFGCVIGVFWGAPLIARELEERTYFVAWGQDVTPVRWLRGKVVVLGLLAVVLGAVIGLGDGFTGDQVPTWGAFEASPAVQAGYALFGLALGVLTGLLTRHVVTAMAATLVFYTLVRVLTSVVVRDHLVPAARSIARWDSTPQVPPEALELGRGFVDSRLDAVAVTAQCQRIHPVNPGNCMASSNAAVGTYVDYQPADRIGLFQFLECGLFVVLALALFAVAFRILRRGGGWKPTRSHRRLAVQSAPETVAAQAEG
ncbi:hypothetical protein [Lentzea sp.]|uniref:hypothetical protein n=1 Tax=Lentzea sp. TaxID=56099 RepID=UPI002B7EDAED|nr:hypothetical protein [Lentzea sp.]HUQ59054.1 hypothetical protein [Lentzea sp.]